MKSSMTDEINQMKTHIEEINTNINLKLDALKESFVTSTKSIQNSISTTSWANIVAEGDKNQNEVVGSFAKKVANSQKTITLDREEREKNVIIFNVPEDKDSKEEDDKEGDEEKKEDEDEKEDENGDEKEVNGKHESDARFFESMCIQNLEYKSTPGVTITRIGSTTNSDYHRPIKVSFHQSFDKRKFLSSLYKLKTDKKFNDIRISHDMSEEDRKENKRLLKEAWEKNKKENNDEFKYKVRGPPWSMKIVKVFSKNVQK